MRGMSKSRKRGPWVTYWKPAPFKEVVAQQVQAAEGSKFIRLKVRAVGHRSNEHGARLFRLYAIK
jgi:hypothetical protein